MPHTASVRRPVPPATGHRLTTPLLLLSLCFPAPVLAAGNLTVTTLLTPLEAPVAGPRARLAIVIDDVGYNLRRAERALKLPVELALGMLPYAPHAPEIARRAHREGREIILHQPMEPLHHQRLEPGTLHLDMSAEKFQEAFSASLARFPYATGVNNHTGSLLTAHRTPMQWLMARIAGRGLYFLDSRTTPHTVAEATARELSVPTIRRDVFLDHIRSEESMSRAFEKSLAIARRRGHAVVIAHPHAITLNFLERKLAELPEDIVLTTLNDLVEPVSQTADRRALALAGNPGARHRLPDR